MKKTANNICLYGCALFVFAGTAAAQTTNATIVGDVTDPQSGAIANATITVKNSAAGITR